MSNIKTLGLFLYIIFTFGIIGISSQIIKKEKVLKVIPPQCKEDKDCSGNVYCSNGYCNIRYFCQNDDCIEQKEGISFEYNLNVNTYKNSNTTDLILESCPEEARNKEKCFTRYCIENDNCYSKKCLNNTCIANKDITTNVCTFSTFDDKINCYKPLQESCTEDDECYPGTCNEYNICCDVPKPYISNALHKLILVFSIILILIIIILVVIKIILKKRNKSKTINPKN